MQPLGRIAASTLCWVSVMSAMSQLVGEIGIRLRWGYTLEASTETLLHSYILPALILVLFTTAAEQNHRDSRPGLARDLPPPTPDAAAQRLLGDHPAAASSRFALLAIRPRTPVPAGRLLWPVPAIVWLLYQVTLLGQLSGVGKTTPFLAGLLLLPWAPPLALGTAITWALTAIYYLDLYQSVPTAPHIPVEAIELLVACRSH